MLIQGGVLCHLQIPSAQYTVYENSFILGPVKKLMDMESCGLSIIGEAG